MAPSFIESLITGAKPLGGSILDKTLESVKKTASTALEKVSSVVDYSPAVVAYRNRDKLAKYYPPAMVVDYLTKDEKEPEVQTSKAGEFVTGAYKEIEGILGETEEVIPNEQKAVEQKERIDSHIKDVKEGFFAKVGRMTTDAFDGKREPPKSFWERLKNIVLDFGVFIKNIFIECKDWASKYLGSWSNLKARMGLESFYWMNKVSPDLADSTLKWGVDAYTKELPPDIKRDFNKVIDSSLEVYNGYSNDKKSKLVNTGTNLIYYLWSESPEDLSKDDLPVIGRTLVDVLYNLKEKAGSEKDFERILGNLQKAVELMSKKEGKNNPALQRLETLIKFDQDDVSNILTKFLYPNKDLYKDKGFFEEMSSDIKGIYKLITSPVDTAIEKGKEKLNGLADSAGEYFAKAKDAVGFTVSDEFKGLVEIIAKKGVGVEALAHIIYNFKQKDVLNFVQAYLEVKNAKLVKSVPKKKGEKPSIISKLFSNRDLLGLIPSIASRLIK